jgi:hypothetical protein
MRVVICFPFDGQTNQALVDACEERGDEVWAVDAMREPTYLYQKLIDLRGKVDLVLMSRTIELFPDFVRAKERYPHIKFAIWNVDVREKIEDWGFLTHFVSEVDYYFTVAYGVVDRWANINPNTHYVPQGVQDAVYHDVVPTKEQIEKYSCDVSFIGNCFDEIHRERRYLLETLRNSHYDFKHLQGVYDNEHNAAVACSRISLCCTHSPSVEYYVSVRDWKIAAAGGIILERWHPGLESMFGGKIALYHDPADCLNKISEILGDYEAWQQKACKLQEWVMATQRYVHRIDQIEGIIS